MPAARGHATGGASLLAVAIAVFMLGAGIAIAIPLMQKSARQALAADVVEDLRYFVSAFQAPGRGRGEWPPAVYAAGKIPAGMESSVDAPWSQPTPIGGRYLWAPDTLQRGRRYRAAMILCSIQGDPVAEDRKLLQEIDRQIDDGNLRSGTFQLGYRDQPFFVFEP